MELEGAADDHRDQRLLHLDPVTGHVAVEAILAVQLDHARVDGAHALVKPPRDAELFVDGVERIPVVRVPVAPVHEVRPDERPDGAEVPHAAHQLAAGQVDVVHGQHRHELQLVGAVLAELVDPVVVGLADRQRELGIHVVAAHERQPAGGIEDRDVHALHRHAHHLGLGVVVALDREVEATGVEDPPSREQLGALGGPGAHPLAILLQIHVRGRLTVDDDETGGSAVRAAVAAHGHADAMLELRVEEAVEEVRGVHDVHVGVDEPESILHGALLSDAVTACERKRGMTCRANSSMLRRALALSIMPKLI